MWPGKGRVKAPSLSFAGGGVATVDVHGHNVHGDRRAMTHSQELTPRVVLMCTLGVAAVMLLAALDGTIVGTAMPRVIAELQGFEHYAAVTTAYMLTATVVVPIVGKLSDLYGRKPFLLLGVAVFTIASALCGAAASMTQLIVFRGIQGLGGGIAQGMAFTTIADLYPPAKRGRATGLLGAVFGLASVIGPAIGGFLTDGPGWRWCFYVNLPVGIAAFALLFVVFPHIVPSANAERRVDWLGAATLVLAVVPLLLALSWGGRDYAWGSFEVLSLLTTATVMGAVFLFSQARTPHAILPPSLFRHRVVWSASAAAILMSFSMFGSILFIPLFIQGVVGRSASASGAVMTPMMVALIGASIAAGQLMTRTGRYKALGVTGMTLTALGMFLLTRMSVTTGYSTVVAYMMVVGLGLGMTLPVFNLAVQNAVDVRHIGVATSSMQFLRSIGGSLGTAVFGAVMASRFATALDVRLTPNLTDGLPPAMMSALTNPQAMMNPQVTAQIRAADPAVLSRMQPLIQVAKGALSASLHDVFLVATFASLTGLMFALLLVDIPLRKSNRQPEPVGELV
jgi:EmrB/QacA subfamily drug resistance transporter